MPAINEPVRAPEFTDGIWVNSAPLTMTGLRGQAVLVEFWDYTCINCLRTLPYMREWWARYRELGLMIIGVHTPEFTFARQKMLVCDAVERLGITYPVMMDNDRQIWSAWANRYWPSRYLVDQRGYLHFFHIGEGDYLLTEANIQILLRQQHPNAQFPPPLLPMRPSDEPGAVCFRCTPEQHLGYRGANIGNLEEMPREQVSNFTMPETLVPDMIYLGGRWLAGAESITLAEGEGQLAMRYRAKEVHVVLAPPESGAGCLEIIQDDIPLPYEALGKDAVSMEDAVVVHVDTPRLYNLVTSPTFGRHELRLRITTPGLSAYAFSFVTECKTAEDLEEEEAV